MSQAGGAAQLAQVLRTHETIVRALGDEMLKVKRRLYRLEAIERLRDAGRAPTMPVEFRSQFGEDVILWELLEGQTDGFFVECGAHDGKTMSVSYVFEAIGWRGLLVEALPDKAEQCRRNRPGSRVVNAAVSGPGASGEAEFTRVEDPWNDGMLSYLGAASAEHAALVGRLGGRETKLRIPMTSFDELLDGHQGPIDFLSLDIEGHELAALNGMTRHRPRVILVEDAARGKANPVIEVLTGKGYTLAGRHQINMIFIDKQDAALLRRTQPAGA